MNLNLESLKAFAEGKIEGAERLLRQLPEDPLSLNRRLAEEIIEMGGWILVLIEGIEGEENE